MENKILVIYVGVAGIRSEDIPDYVHKVATKITPTTFKGEIILLPAQSIDTRIECINPQYITEPELIKEHQEMIKKLQEALQNQLEQLKQEKSNEQET
jgi:hypothetical protein